MAKIPRRAYPLKTDTKYIRTNNNVIQHVNKILLSSKVPNPVRYQRTYLRATAEQGNTYYGWYHHDKDSKISKANDTAMAYYYMMYNYAIPLQQEINSQLLAPLFLLSCNSSCITSAPFRQYLQPLQVLGGLFTLKDGKYWHKNKKYDIKDKNNNKSVYPELNKITRKFRNKLKSTNNNNQAFFMGDPENNNKIQRHMVTSHSHGIKHITFKLGKMYTHPHNHLLSVTENNNSLKDTNYLKQSVNNVTGYKALTGSTNIFPIYWKNYQHNNHNFKNSYNKIYTGKIGDDQSKIINVPTNIPKALVLYDVLLKYSGESIKISDTLLTLLATDFYILYMCQDYHAQFKDTDEDFYNFKESDLNSSQLALAYKSQVSAASRTRVLETASKSMLDQMPDLKLKIKLAQLSLSCSYYLPIPYINNLAKFYTNSSWKAQSKHLFKLVHEYKWNTHNIPAIDYLHLENYKQAVLIARANPNHLSKFVINKFKQIHFDLECEISYLNFHLICTDGVNGHIKDLDNYNIHAHTNQARMMMRDKINQLIFDERKIAKEYQYIQNIMEAKKEVKTLAPNKYAYDKFYWDHVMYRDFKEQDLKEEQCEFKSIRFVHEYRYHRTIVINLKSIFITMTYIDASNICIEYDLDNKNNSTKNVLFGTATSTPP